MSSKPNLEHVQCHDPRIPDADNTNKQVKDNVKQARARRLSQTEFGAENRFEEEPITISVPVPVMIGEQANKPVRRRKERRSSYIQFDSDPRGVVSSVASACVAGAESGMKKRNQDAALIQMDDNTCLFAVFDGHGHQGHHCSNFLKTSLPAMIKMKLLEDVSTAETISSALLEAESSMLKAPFDCSLSGSTATVAMLQSSRLIVSWVGDSPCFVISYVNDTWICKDLAPPHNFDKLGERERILAKGGRVMRWEDDGDWIGPLRVFLPDRPIPGLNMSRSLADTMAHKIGVSSEPEMNTIDLDASSRYLIISSDGLTEFLTQEEIMQMITEHDDIQEACDLVVSVARRRWIESEDGCADDISAIVVKINAGAALNIQAV